MYALAEKLINATAWTMTPPPAYGLFHITFTVVGFLLSIFLALNCESSAKKEIKSF